MQLARVAGLLYLIIFVMAPFAEFFVRQSLIIPGDPATTADNIVANEGMFRAGFVTDLIVFVIEVAQAAILYVLFRPVSRPLALIMSFARLAQATILGLNLLNMFVGLQLLVGPEAAGLGTAQAESLAYVFLRAQSFGYELGLAFFALHLFTLGYLVYKSGFLPKWLGVWIVGSALGYTANSLAVFLAPDLADVTGIAVIAAALVGELPFTLWLLIKGVDVDRWYARAEPPVLQRAVAGASS